MVGRNDRCPCGSGKKYKKCCESNEQIVVQAIHLEELERILQSFYEIYPERKDIPQFIELANKWKSKLDNQLDEEMIEAIVLDEFFFQYRHDIWQNYLEKVQKKQLRDSIIKVLKTWLNPKIFLGEVTHVEEAYLTAKSIFTDEVIKLRRESEKPVSNGAFVYCFILPDGTAIQNHYLAVSSLIFFPVDHKQVFNDVKKNYIAQGESLSSFWKEEALPFWSNLVDEGYEGEEFSQFEEGVLDHLINFLENQEQQSERLLEVVEDYLVELQPNARKAAAIAAGAVRFGLDNDYINNFHMTFKEIAESFKVSTSSMNKYHKELQEYANIKA